MLTTHIYSDILQNAPFRGQIFNIFFASGGKGALTPLTKILRTFLCVGREAVVRACLMIEMVNNGLLTASSARARWTARSELVARC